MAGEKVAKLGVKRESSHLYFITGEGHVARKAKNGAGDHEILHHNVVQRENTHLYYLDKEGDVSRSPRVSRKAK